MSKNRRESKQQFYSKGRVKRGPAPLASLTRKTYRKALPELRRDFQDRCAYCMRHIGTKTDMQIDHFDPRKKNDKIQIYANLFLSDAHCNRAKSDIWPTDEERRLGCRFLNCCNEQDYGESIFEDPVTHKLVGTTPAAIFHIETIDLNDPGLVNERKIRNEMTKNINDLQTRLGNDPNVALQLSKLQAAAEYFIPIIPPPQA